MRKQWKPGSTSTSTDLLPNDDFPLGENQPIGMRHSDQHFHLQFSDKKCGTANPPSYRRTDRLSFRCLESSTSKFSQLPNDFHFWSDVENAMGKEGC